MKSYFNMTLEELLIEVNNMFHPKINICNVKKTICHSFDLYNHNGYWGFKVINSWKKWLDKKLEYDFGLYRCPRHAILAFIRYVLENKIKVNKFKD